MYRVQCKEITLSDRFRFNLTIGDATFLHKMGDNTVIGKFNIRNPQYDI